MKDLRDIFFVVGQVIVKGRFQFDVGVLQLDKDQRDSVDVQDDIGAAITGQRSRARRLNPQLGDGEVVVVGGIIKVNQANAFLIFHRGHRIRLRSRRESRSSYCSGSRSTTSLSSPTEMVIDP